MESAGDYRDNGLAIKADQVSRLDRNSISEIIGQRPVFLGDDLSELLPAWWLLNFEIPCSYRPDVCQTVRMKWVVVFLGTCLLAGLHVPRYEKSLGVYLYVYHIYVYTRMCTTCPVSQTVHKDVLKEEEPLSGQAMCTTCSVSQTFHNNGAEATRALLGRSYVYTRLVGGPLSYPI